MGHALLHVSFFILGLVRIHLAQPLLYAVRRTLYAV